MKRQLKKICLLALVLALSVLALASCDVVNRFISNTFGSTCTHEFEEIERLEPSCTSGGKIVRECSKCKTTETEILHSLGHSFDLEEFGYREENGHAHKCSVCGAHDTVASHVSGGPATEEEHELCTECGFVITPALNHEHDYSILEGDTSGHWYECICGEKASVSAHTGGTATCSDEAVCEVCSESYGSLDYENHSLYISDERAATCSAGGIKITACHGCSYTITEVTDHLEHEWSTDAVTCTVGKYCTREDCDMTVPAAGHSYELTATTAATCTEDGVATYTCSACGDYYTNVVEHSTGHTVSTWTVQSEVAVAGVACKYQQIYEGVCETCGGISTKSEEVDRHEYRVTVSVEATCTVPGTKKYTCSVEGCGHSYDETYTDATAHVWGEGVTADGVTTYTCACGETRTVISSKTETNSSVDSETLKDVGEVELKDASIALDKETADALNGNVNISANTQKKEEITDVKISPEMGEQIGESDIFEFTMSDENGEVEAFAGKVTVKIPYTLTAEDDPDCIAVWWLTEDENGEPTLQYVEAKYSGGYVVFETEHFSYYTVTRMTPAERCAYRGHEDRVLISAATCTEDGYETHICLRCGRTEVIKGEDAKGHEFEEEYNDEATCTKHGKVGHKCNSCGKKNEEHKPATGHEWKLDSSAAASCLAPGHATNKCGKCGELDKEIIPQKSHNYVPSTVEPTCTEYGYTLYTCDHCSSTKKENYVNPLGHKYEEVRVEPTCTEDGYIKKVCACGDETTEKIKKTGHMWNIKNPTCGEDKYCLVCKHVDKVATGKHNMKDGICKVCGAGCDHKYVEVERIAATCIAEGKVVKACSCGSRVTELLAKVGHSWNLDAPTCGTDKFCTVCKTVSLAATGNHTIVDGLCSVCGSPCAHAYKVIETVAPDCENYGYSTEKCDICGDEKQTNVTAALGHTNGKICARCGEVLIEGAVGYYTNMLDSFLNLKLNVELRDVVVYQNGSKINEKAWIELDELWLTEDADGNIIGYGVGTITVTEDGELQVGKIEASVVDDMFCLKLDVDAGYGTNQHGTLVYPMDNTSNPISSICSIYKWYKKEAYPILSALIAANVQDADRIISGFMDALFVETTADNGNAVYTLDLNKVLELNDALSKKTIKEVYEDIFGGNFADLEDKIAALLDTSLYDLAGSLESEGVSREDVFGAVYAFMEMASGGAPMTREEFIAEALVTDQMKATIAELIYGSAAYAGTIEEFKAEITGAITQLGGVSVYELMLPMFGYTATESNIATAKDEVAKVITEQLFDYFTFATELNADGTINNIDFTLKNNEYITGGAKIYFGYETDVIPEDITSDDEGLGIIFDELDAGIVTKTFYVVSSYDYNSGYDSRFIASTIDEALQLIEKYGFGASAQIVKIERTYDTSKLNLRYIQIDAYCGWIDYDVYVSQADENADLSKGYMVAIAEDGTVTETLAFEGSSQELFDYYYYYNTEDGTWAMRVPYELREHKIVELEDKRVEPEGCEGLGKAYYYCEKCGIEYSVDIFNGHKWESSLELVDPNKGCEGGVNATHTCADCGEVVTETLNWHYRATLIRVDLEELGCCGGYIEVSQCACGESSDFDRYSANCSWAYDSSDGYTDANGVYHERGRYRCLRCGISIVEDSYTVYEGCYRVRYNSVSVTLDDTTLIDNYSYIAYREENHRYEASFNLYGESCDDGYDVIRTCAVCGDSYTYSSSGHNSYPTKYIDLAEQGSSCGGYIQLYSCPCGENSYFNVDTGCHFSYSSNYYPDENGHSVYVDVRTCMECGLRVQESYYVEKDASTCTEIEYRKGIVSIGNVAASYEREYKRESHNMKATGTLMPGATSCEDGVMITETCLDCGLSYSREQYWHSEYDIERIDLSELGCVCGGYVAIRGCACGYFHNVSLDECFCEFDQRWTGSTVWPEGAIENGWQWSTQGEQYFGYDAYEYVCSVTDPERCGYIIRLATYWKKDGCYAERYRTYQFGYNPETGECEYELTYKFDEHNYEKRQYHAYGEGVTTSDGNSTTTVYTCLDCGSTYTYISSYDEATGTSRNDRIAVNNLNTTDPIRLEDYYASRSNWHEDYYRKVYADGSVRDYKEIYTHDDSYVGPFGNSGYKVTYVYSGSETNERTYEYAHVSYMGYSYEIYNQTTYPDGRWERHDYIYNTDMICEYTRVYTNSEGERWEDYGTNHHYNGKEVRPTCTQDGYYSHYCVVCGHESKGEISPAYGHQWVPFGDSYVCNACGLENVNGADGEVVLEDLTWRYGKDGNYVVGYYSKEYISFIYSVSLLVKGADGEFEEKFLDDIEIGDHATLRAKVFSIEAVKAAAAELGYDSDDYLIRFAFVPLGADGSFDYAITFEEFDPLSEIITGNSLVPKFVGAGETVNISIVPEKSGYFRIMSTCESGDPCATLYDANGNHMVYNDDGAGNLNFLIEVYLEAGETYTLSIRWLGTDVSGVIPVQSTFTPA